MINPARLKDIVTQAAYSREEKVLIALAVEPVRARQVKEIRDLLASSGVRAAAKWNISSLLSRLGELVARTDGGWELTSTGHHTLSELVGPHASSPVPRVASALRHHLVTISNADTKAYVEEAVLCFEARLYRAAVVLSWVGAISVLHHDIVANHLADFNKEVARRDAKWRDAKNEDDLGRMKEHDFLQILAALSIIGKNVKQELEKRLALRNASGHPSSLALGEHMVAAHIESLILNVYSRFG